jgi:hypothetical protein
MSMEKGDLLKLFQEWGREDKNNGGREFNHDIFDRV